MYCKGQSEVECLVNRNHHHHQSAFHRETTRNNNELILLMSDVCFLSYRNYNLTVPYYGTMNAHQNVQTKIKNVEIKYGVMALTWQYSTF